jgi:hypothetical protein
MAALVWFTMGVALWHFTVFVPDRFRAESWAPSLAPPRAQW